VYSAVCCQIPTFYTKPWFQGMYWWKVGTDGFGGPEDGSNTPWGKTAMDVVKNGMCTAADETGAPACGVRSDG
jgi:hypothetical protein